MNLKSFLLAIALPALAGNALNAAPLGTTFTLQARLNNLNGTPVDGTVPVDFSLWDAAMGGINVGTPALLSKSVAVNKGTFTVDTEYAG